MVVKEGVASTSNPVIVQQYSDPGPDQSGAKKRHLS